MHIVFEKCENKHQKEVMDIFNYYVEKSNCLLLLSIGCFKK